MNRIADGFLRQSVTFAAASPPPWKLESRDSLFFAGSCFATHLYDFWNSRFLVGEKAVFGNIYNPESLKETIRCLTSAEGIRNEDLFFHQGLWRHSLFDTFRTSENRESLLKDLNRDLDSQRQYLKSCSCAVLTLGTAWVYRETRSGKTVNNCHKRPGGDFRRELLTPGEIREALFSVCKNLSACTPGIRIILTLSPVRHLRDSAEENSVSKALLRGGLHEVCSANQECYYFPAFEIMMDELRDYRWYKDDLTHPSQTAVNYIMARFCETTGSEGLSAYLADAEKLGRLLNHRVQNPGSPEGIGFREKVRSSREEFIKKYPFSRVTAADIL